MYTTSHLLVLTVLISSLLAIPLSAATKDGKPPKLFSDADELNVTLSGPWRTITRKIRQDALYPAQLTYTGTSGEQQTMDVKVAPRGLTRRLRVCDFPPLKIHFDKEMVKGTEFRGNKSLKLVTYCDTSTKYEQYYIKEFLIYRIYNLITEYSFRVRPMMIEYRDSGNQKSLLTRFGFLIEDLDDVAKRNDLEKLSVPKISYKDLDSVEISNFALFQYMIGNLDWAVTDGPGDDSCCHNAKLIGAGNDMIPKYGIPYDFDSSGLVNAHYALPPDGLRVRNIRQRLYRGYCPSNETLPQAVKLFNDKRADILALFKNNLHLNDKTHTSALRYINDFYEIINDPKKFQKEIIDKCRG